MAEALVLQDRSEGVVTLTLNRPDRHNAWTIPMQRMYYGMLDDCNRNPEVRVIIVTGAGDSFCPGADTEELTVYTETGEFNPEMAEIEQSDIFPWGVQKPMIAAINGRCAGIGLSQALQCDIRFGAAGAKLTTAFARRGLPALHGVGWLLPRLIGLSRATELLLSGRAFTMEEAHEIGLVHVLAEPADVLARAQAYAADLAANCSPRSWREMKEQLRSAMLTDLATAARDALEREAVALQTPDFAEGVRSFIERRPPNFPPI